MKIIIFMICVFAFAAGCRRELPVENDQQLSGNNPGSVSILSPLDSDEYAFGEEVFIKWLPVNERVKLELFRKTEFKLDIASDVTANGEFFWLVPDHLDPSINYRIKIIPRANPANYVYSEEFTIKGF